MRNKNVTKKIYEKIPGKILVSAIIRSFVGIHTTIGDANGVLEQRLDTARGHRTKKSFQIFK